MMRAVSQATCSANPELLIEDIIIDEKYNNKINIKFYNLKTKNSLPTKIKYRRFLLARFSKHKDKFLRKFKERSR